VNAGLTYVRMRIRVSRSFALNILLLTATAVYFTTRQGHGFVVVGEIVRAELLIGLILVTAGLWAWWRFESTFGRKLALVHLELQAGKPQTWGRASSGGVAEGGVSKAEPASGGAAAVLSDAGTEGGER